MQAGAKTGSREVERTENAVFGALMAAFMGVSPFVANAAVAGPTPPSRGRLQAQRATRARFRTTRPQAAPATGRASVDSSTPPRGKWARSMHGLLRTGRVCAPAGAEAGSRVKVWINQAGDVVAPPLRQAEIANRVELAQGLAAAGFAAGLGVIGWLTRQSLDRRRRAA